MTISRSSFIACCQDYKFVCLFCRLTFIGVIETKFFLMKILLNFDTDTLHYNVKIGMN